MAEIQTTSLTKQKGVQKCKKLSTRVDLTPMVDLGFLLITFFIFTTTLNEPKITKLVMPSDEVDNNPLKIPKSKVLQVLLAGNDKVHCYFGDDISNSTLTNFSANGLRAVILNKQNQLAEKYGDKQVLILIIKPSAACSFKNIIDVLDEVQINNVKHYVFMETSKEDQKILLRS